MTDINDIVKKFEDERAKWSNIITDFASKFREVYKLPELQVELYSNRQILVEYMYRLISLSGKMEKDLRIEKRKSYDKYTNKFDYKATSQERELLMEGDNADLLERTHHIKSHIDFIRETIKGMDNMIYGINHRIKLEEYKHVNNH
jgi:hypothetical protein